VDAQGFIVIGCCAVWCWSAVHVARRVWARHKRPVSILNRAARRHGDLLFKSYHLPYPRGGSNRPTASTGMRAAGMRSQIGAVARLPITADTKSTWGRGPEWLLEDFLEIPPPRPLHSKLPWPTRSGYETEDHGVSGRSADGSAVAELWGDFEWIDAA
jgi:hypothetical protein